MHETPLIPGEISGRQAHQWIANIRIAVEAAETVKLSSLRAVGEALNCDLVYALVPRTSLEDSVRRRARLVAERVVRRVSQSMDLEDQAIPIDERERQVSDLAEELWQQMPQELWDDSL